MFFVKSSIKQFYLCRILQPATQFTRSGFVIFCCIRLFLFYRLFVCLFVNLLVRFFVFTHSYLTTKEITSLSQAMLTKASLTTVLHEFFSTSSTFPCTDFSNRCRCYQIQKHSILEAKYSIEVIFKLPRETADDRFLQKCAVYQPSLHN